MKKMVFCLNVVACAFSLFYANHLNAAPSSVKASKFAVGQTVRVCTKEKIGTTYGSDGVSYVPYISCDSENRFPTGKIVSLTSTKVVVALNSSSSTVEVHIENIYAVEGCLTNKVCVGASAHLATDPYGSKFPIPASVVGINPNSDRILFDTDYEFVWSELNSRYSSYQID